MNISITMVKMRYIYPRVRELRKSNDLTQQKVADYLGLHLTQYQRYEHGESEIPVHILLKLRKLYNTTLDYLTETAITEEN